MTETIGTVAGILTTVSFAPQAIRTWRMGGEGLSWTMLVLFGTGVGLWFVYGLLRDSLPIMLANGLTEMQVLSYSRSRSRAGERPLDVVSP